MDRDDPAYRGQADYSRPLLRLYDPLVLGPIARYVWRCPSDRLLEPYRRHLRGRHLDVGPGTGFFLERSGMTPDVALTVLDPNTTVLRYVAARLDHPAVTAVEADVCKPLPVAGPYDSAAMNLVIHCLPGPFERKAGAVANVATAMAPDGVLFGSSVIGESGTHNVVARAMLRAYNRRGAFDNLEDSESSISQMLTSSFEDVEMETVGSIAIFAARHPRSA